VESHLNEKIKTDILSSVAQVAHGLVITMITRRPDSLEFQITDMTLNRVNTEINQFKSGVYRVTLQ
jgi:hypothetical protein